MKKTYLFLCLSFIFGISVLTLAQPDPSTLKHQWTFDDGTAKDGVGTLDGTLMDGATISNNALNTTKGGWVDFSGPDLAINGYTSITTEVWFTAAIGNGNYTMLTVYGNTGTGGGGENYLCTNPTHGNEGSRTAITTNNPDNWSGDESGANGPKCDDGVLHQLVSVVDGLNMTISLYIDGVLQQSNPLLFNNMIGLLGTDHFYMAKSDWAPDPTWKGLMEKVSIYDAALSPEQIQYLFSKGAETKQTITAGAPSFVFDSHYSDATTTLTGSNLASPISITCPAGITAQFGGSIVTSIPANSENASVTFSYDGTTAVDGNIVLTSGTAPSISIPVKGVSDATCFTPLYDGNLTNYIPGNGGMNSFDGFAGWGTKTIETLINDPADVYCGGASMKLGDGTTAGLASLDFHPGLAGDPNNLSGLLAPNTTYRVKLMAKTTGVFNVGIERTDVNNSLNTNNKILHNFDTGGQWKTVDFYFTTGDAVDADPVIYINAFQLSGTIAFVDNWEIYPTTDPLIIPTLSSLAFDPESKTASFNVTSVNLVSDITVTAPAGITVDQTTIAQNVPSAPVTVTWDGTTPVNGKVTLTSGATTVSIALKSVANSNTSCFTPLFTDANHLNLIPDPYFNDQTKFNGWAHNGGSWGLINATDNPDSVYCGSHSAKLFISADIEVPLTGMLNPNYSYEARAMVRTFGYFHMGINGEDTAIPGDVKDSINTNGEWQQMIFEFNTGSTLADTPVLFFNNDGNTGRLAYLDNWELYQKDAYNALVPVKDQFSKLYVQNGKIVAEFDLENNSPVQLTVYTVMGAMVSDQKIAGTAGRNKNVVNAFLPTGVYMVKLTKNGQTSFRKLIN
jgi:hypothetical protein